MPISADQWRSVTGLNNASRRPRQLGLKQYFFQRASQCAGNSEKLSNHPEAESSQDTTGRAGTKKPGVRKRSKQKDNFIQSSDSKVLGSDTKESHACTEKGWSKQSGSCPESARIIWRWEICSLFTFQCLVTLVVWFAVISWSFLWDTNKSTLASVQGATRLSNETCIIAPGVFEVSSVGVGVQSFISVIVMMLLLLAGDVETNPGPTDYLSLESLCEVNGAVFGIRAKWKLLGLELTIDAGTLRAIGQKNQDNPDNCLYDVLENWLSKGEGTWKQLIRALRQQTVGENSLAEKLEQKYSFSGKRPCNQSDVPFLKRHCSDNGHIDDGCITAYAETLKTNYSAQTLPAEGMLKHSTKICRLAMIKKEKVTRQEIQDEFVQHSITGKVDDILHMKTPVELEDIFKDVPDNRKVVLVEGAPGAGKSSLSLNICKKWSEGELLQEFKAVILVRLRDPLVQEAQTLADLLPYCDNSQNVASAIMSTQGSDILWVLDGWDEFPDKLKKDENCCIRNMVHRQNHDSSVIVTSRPTSSVDLHLLVSKRIEVLGFTSEELKEYFKERFDGDTDSVETLLEKIKEHPEVVSSCYLPLHAAFIADTFVVKKELPATQYCIFETVVIKCISRQQIKEGKKQIESLDELPDELNASFDAICELAYRGISENKVIFTESELPDCFKPLDLLQEVESMLAFQRSSKTYNFLHLSVQEFLAAQHFATKPLYDHQWLFRGFMDDERCLPMLTFYAAKTKLRTPGITEYLSRLYEKMQEYKFKNELELQKLAFVLRCVCETEDPSLCKPLVDVVTENTVELFWYSVGYLLGSFISLTSKADIGHHIKVDLGRSDIAKEDLCLFLKGLLRFSKDPVVSTTLDICLPPKISSESIILFKKVLRDTQLVSNLKILGADDIDMSMLQQSTSLCKLELEGTLVPYSIVVGEKPSLKQVLLSNPALTILNICGMKFSDIDIEQIAQVLQSNSTLKELKLVRSNITSNGVKFLSKALRINCTLESLTLSSNEIGDKGASLIAGALHHDNKTLTCLILEDCGITTTVSTILLDVFQRGVLNTLVITTNAQTYFDRETFVDLPANFKTLQIPVNTYEGATALKEVLENDDFSPVVLTVDLRKGSSNEFCVIVDTLQDSNVLKYLRIQNCNITAEELNSLGKALAINETLKEVYIDGSLVETEHDTFTDDFIHCLKRNTSLEKLRLPYSNSPNFGVVNAKDLVNQVNTERSKTRVPTKLLVLMPVCNYDVPNPSISYPMPLRSTAPQSIRQLQDHLQHNMTQFSQRQHIRPLSQVYPHRWTSALYQQAQQHSDARFQSRTHDLEPFQGIFDPLPSPTYDFQRPR